MFKELREQTDKIYLGNKERGFWEEGLNRNKGELVMLMITELSEAVEAHRKDRFAKLGTSCIDLLDGHIETDQNYWSGTFSTKVKDSVEDEIADAVIRILDYCGGFSLPLIERDYRKESTRNFSHDVLRLTKYCIDAYHEDVEEISVGRDWGYVLAAIIKFCEWYNIDILKHVEWKLKYNATRPFKHGKKY